MSPYPSQTNSKTVIETARILIEHEGVEALSLGKIAAELGIKAPSLYRHIKNKHALLQAVVERTYLRLFDAYDHALANADDDPIEQLLRLSLAQREFAANNPNTYMLAYSTQSPASETNPTMLLDRAILVQQIISQISGEEDSLPALRGLLAITHGFVMLELNGQFRRGGDLSETMEKIIEKVVEKPKPAPSRRGSNHR